MTTAAPARHPERMDITRVRSDDEAGLRALWRVQEAARQADRPWMPAEPVDDILGDEEVTRSRRLERWAARLHDEVIGSLLIELPLLDNTDNAAVDLQVHPQHRRQGVGRALLDLARRRAAEESRRKLIGEVADPLVGRSAGSAFAQRAGAKQALVEMCRVLDVAALDDTRLAALDAEARSAAGEYEVVQWVGPAPDDVVDEMADLSARLSTDAPMDDLDWQAEVWDAARYRESEARATAQHRLWVTSAARHVASGSVVAYTDIGWSTTVPEDAFQWTTIVEEKHRGHRLGMLLKVANTDLLRREVPPVQRVFAWNAVSNTHMVAINEALGFRPAGVLADWQLDL